MVLGADSVDEVDIFHGALGKANLFPTAVRPFGLASIGPNWKHGVTTYSCAHIQGTGGSKWNYLAPTFALTTGVVSPNPSALKLSVGMEKLQYEGRADSLRVNSNNLGYSAEIVATLRGGMIVAKSTDGKPLNVVFPVGFYAAHLKNTGTCTLTDSNGAWSVDVMQDTTLPVFGRFEFNVAPLNAGTWAKGKITNGPATVSGDDDNLAGVFLTFPAGVEVRFRLGVSFTDLNGARRNLATEIPHWNAEKIREEAHKEWQQQLDRVRVTGGTASQRKLFATALYQACIAPHVYEDVDGRYRAFEKKAIKGFGRGLEQTEVRTLKAPRQHQYATFSGWDTFRTLMPLLALIEPERYSDMCASLIEMGQQVSLPRWPLANRPGITMVGNPIEHILATGRSHQVDGVDYPAALALMQQSMAKQLATDFCLADDYNGTVAIAALAGYLGQQELADKWWSKTLGYRQFFDPSRKVFVHSKQGKSVAESISANNADKRKNDNVVTSMEGNRDTYVWYNAMWDPEGLAALLGGHEKALEHLKGYMDSDKVAAANRNDRSKIGVASSVISDTVDFANENDLHIPFIATLWGDPGLTRATLLANLPKMFQDDSPRGRPGNDDCGTMSAWLVLVQSGLYSFNPACGWYVLTAPAFPKVEINLGRGGKRLVITANSTNEEDVIQQVKRDGVVRAEPWLLAADICKGGQLDFTLGPGTSSWAKNPSTPPLPFSVDKSRDTTTHGNPK
ncbi:MAG: glycoside hydrolase domain-containing protein [Verrucomicrobiota bacterium]